MADVWSQVPLTSVSIPSKDKPTVPKGPIDCSDFTKESVRLTWREPEDDGGVPITGYTVEKKDAKKDNWSEAIRNTPSLSGVVNNLTYGKDYVFRVVAVNSIGSSPPLEGRPTKVKLPFGELSDTTETNSSLFKIVKNQISWQECQCSYF